MAGSLGYAERLSWKEDVGGRLGDPEVLDSGDLASCPKLAELVRLVQRAERVVVHTGAGVSTAAGIPDFRGPQGVWTLQKAGKPLPSASCAFDRARPTLTHQALVALQRAGKLSYLVSCNVDCLHQRSGYPRALLAELHGNCFAERCERCGCEAVRDFEQTTVGFRRTGRACTRCGGPCRDQVLDWDDPLPPAELALAERHSSEAQLTLTLGTSLQIHPACQLPLRTLKAGGKLVIVNLQPTPKDKHASLVIRRRADDVLRVLMSALGLAIPPFVRHDSVRVRHVAGNGSARGGTAFTLHVQSQHGAACPVPWLQSAWVRFPDGDATIAAAQGKRRRDAAATEELDADGVTWHALVGERAPWRLKGTATPAPGETLRTKLRCLVRLVYAVGATEAPAVREHVLDLEEKERDREGALLTVCTTRVDYA